MNYKDKKYIFFDLDGTLMDPKPQMLDCLRYSLDRFGIDFSVLGNTDELFVPTFRLEVKQRLNVEPELADEVLGVYQACYSEHYLPLVKLYDGAAELLRDLHSAGKIISLVTSKPEMYISPILDMFNIREYIAHASAGSVAVGKNSKPDIMRGAVLKCGMTDPADGIYIGDRQFDVLAAHESGVPIIGVRYGYGSEGEAEAAGADVLVNSIDEIRELLL